MIFKLMWINFTFLILIVSPIQSINFPKLDTSKIAVEEGSVYEYQIISISNPDRLIRHPVQVGDTIQYKIEKIHTQNGDLNISIIDFDGSSREEVMNLKGFIFSYFVYIDWEFWRFISETSPLPHIESEEAFTVSTDVEAWYVSPRDGYFRSMNHQVTYDKGSGVLEKLDLRGDDFFYNNQTSQLSSLTIELISFPRSKSDSSDALFPFTYLVGVFLLNPNRKIKRNYS